MRTMNNLKAFTLCPECTNARLQDNWTTVNYRMGDNAWLLEERDEQMEQATCNGTKDTSTTKCFMCDTRVTNGYVWRK